jgi:hypothetical protein
MVTKQRSGAASPASDPSVARDPRSVGPSPAPLTNDRGIDMVITHRGVTASPPSSPSGLYCVVRNSKK